MGAPRSTRIARGVRKLVAFLAVAYPVVLVAAIASMRWVGEAWWVTAALLYLPRIGFALPLPFLSVALLAFRRKRLLLLQIVCLGLVMFPLMGFVPPIPTRAVQGRPSLRVLTFNVNSCAGGVDAVVEEIDRFAPDVVLAQEIGGDDLPRLLRARYPAVEVSGQFLIATRYSASSKVEPHAIPYQGKERSARFLKEAMDTPLGPIVFYNIHPISPRTGLYTLRTHGIRSLLRGASAGSLEADTGLRALQVKTFADAAATESDPVVIGGDFNLPGLSAVFGQYLSGYQDGFDGAGRGFGYTFPTNAKRWWPWMRIDRILADRRLRFTRFEVGTSLVSDHHCVVADLQLRGH
jgi:endonuclease/exonuclease/phosphatase (EEP) superfamily protein YafD